jgi:predicted ATP-dependent serine protease
MTISGKTYFECLACGVEHEVSAPLPKCPACGSGNGITSPVSRAQENDSATDACSEQAMDK